jgi:hypothetical protein
MSQSHTVFQASRFDPGQIMDPQRLWVNPDSGFTSASFSQYRYPNQAHSQSNTNGTHIHDDFHIRPDQVGYDATPPLGTPPVGLDAQLQQQPNVEFQMQINNELWRNLLINPLNKHDPVRAIEAFLQGLPDSSEWITFWPGHQQEIENMSVHATDQSDIYDTISFLFDAMLDPHTGEPSDEKVFRVKQMIDVAISKAAITQKKVERARKLASRFEVGLPELLFPTQGYRYLPISPCVGVVPSHLNESLHDRFKALKAYAQGLPDNSEKIQLLPFYKQQVENMSIRAIDQLTIYVTMRCMLDAMISLHTGEPSDEKVFRIKLMIDEPIIKEVITQKKVERARKLASRFEVGLQEPECINPLSSFLKEMTCSIFSQIHSQQSNANHDSFCMQMDEVQSNLLTRPNVGLIPIFRYESVHDHVKAIKASVQALPDKPEKIELLPFHKQEIKNKFTHSSDLVDAYETLCCVFTAVVARRTGELFDEKLHLAKKMIYQQSIKAAFTQNKVDCAIKWSQYDNKGLQQPELLLPPLGFHKDPRWTEVTYICKQIPMCDPSKPGVKFKTLWTKIVRYSKGKYFTEAEYLDVLGAVLDGDSFVDFDVMERREKKPLHYIVNHLALLFDD